jgi:zinc protease
MKQFQHISVILVLCFLVACASTATNTETSANGNPTLIGLAAHPADLQFADHQIKIPDTAQYRHSLDNGNVAYIVPDHSLPLVAINVYSRAGKYMLSAEDVGLAGLTATMMRNGGTRALSPEDLDEKLEFLATNVAVSIGNTSSFASMNSLSRNLDESLGLLFDMLAEPRFDGDRLEIKKNQVIEALKRRNDDTRTIEQHVYSELRYGANSYRTYQATAAQIEAIDTDRMQALVARVFASPNLVISVNGDVEAKAVVASLNREIARLNQGVELPVIPTKAEPAAAGLYGVDKDDVTQTRVRMFHPGPRRGDPQEFAIKVMNDILGGGGFTSRITKRIRNDEGLAYSAGSVYPLGVYYPGTYIAYFQSKNQSVAEATKLALEEIGRIQNTPVSAQELDTARQAVISVLNERYSNAARKATAFANDDLQGTPANYWSDYEKNTTLVSIDDVQKAAKDHLHPDELLILLTGKLSETIEGDGEHGTMETVTGLEMQQLPLKDPLTLEPLPLD